VQAVTLHSPPRPRKVNPDIPEDLERIVLTATAKLPEERYASAEDLISDLKAFLDGRPIRARAPGKLYLARLFLRRNRGLAAVAATALVLLALGSALYIRDLRRLVHDLEQARDSATRLAVFGQLGSAAQALESQKVSLARRYLDDVPESARDWVWSTLSARLDLSRLVVDAGAPSVVDGTLDATETRVAVLREGSVRVHALEDGALLGEERSNAGRHVAFVPGEDALLVVEGDAGTPRVLSFAGPASGPASGGAAAFSDALAELRVTGVDDVDASGGRVALALTDGRVIVFEEGALGAPRRYESAPGRGHVVALFGGDGRVAHAVAGDGGWILGPSPARRVRLPTPAESRVVALSGARDEPVVLALSDAARVARFVDEGGDATPTPAQQFGIETGVRRVVLAPDGERFVLATRIGRTRMWSIRRAMTARQIPSMSSLPTVLLWPDGGDELVLAGGDGAWRASPAPKYLQGPLGVSWSVGHYGNTRAFALDPSGAWAAVGEETGGWSLWSLERRLPVAGSTDSLERIRSVALRADDDGPTALALGGEGLRVWSAATGDVERLDAAHGPFVHVAWEGSALVASAERGDVLRAVRSDGGGWSVESVAQLDGPILSVASLRSDDALLVGTAGGAVERVAGIGPDARGPARVERAFDLGIEVKALGVGELGSLAAAVTRDNRLHLLDLSSRPPSVRWVVQAAEFGETVNEITSVAVDEASGWVVTCGADGWTRTWSALDGRAGPDLLRLFHVVTEVAFPAPGAPPVVLDRRGRINHFEVDPIDRSGGAPGVTPTAVEESILERLSPSSRIRQVEIALRRDDLTPAEAWAVWQIADGVVDHRRYNKGTVGRARAERALARALERYRELEAVGAD
ncbi:MAG: hypothetical protein AAGB93_15495, partial [Planctomycetota bacterium]